VTLRRPLLVLVALVLALAAFACGGATSARRITVWHAYRGDEERALKEVAARYEVERGVKVTLLSVPFDAYLSKLQAAVPRGNGPDVFIDAHGRLGTFTKEGLVADASGAIGEADVARFDETSVRALTQDGKRWGVPLATKCLALFVNTRLVTSEIATLEDVQKLRATLPASAVPLAYEAHTTYYHVPFLHAFGAELLGSAGDFAMVGRGAEDSVALVRDLTKDHVIPDEPSGALVKQLFVQGQAAVVISGPWLLSELRDEVPFKVQPLPTVAKTGKKMRPYLTVEAAFVTPDGAGKPDAVGFARWLGDDASARTRALVGKQVVATKSAWADPEVARSAALAAFHAAAADAVPTPTSTRLQATWVPADQAIKKVLRGEAEPKAALDEAKARFDDVMRPPPPSPSPAPVMLLAGGALLALAYFGVKRAQAPGFRAELTRSLPVYRYVIHAVVTVCVLVVLPLVAGAATSFFAGGRGETRFVGFENYAQILTARGGALLGHGSFYLTLLVTILWTVLNVAAHVGIGLALGLALARPWLRLKAVWRVLLILPWAVPSYVTAVAWKGMFHRQFGAMNAILSAVGAPPVSWFSHFSTAFTANLLTNVWLGFPFMMVVTLGALTSIPKDVLEAAEVDGATRWQRFRHVTAPLLLPQLLPSIMLGSVWTFNMFNVVFLVSGGEPDGTTDILVSEAYRWAFTRDSQYGYAAAYAVLIFLLLFVATRLLGARVDRAKAKVA
jgi:arabinogalactan oligomer/maltooligosaccharide transport system permease protein